MEFEIIRSTHNSKYLTLIREELSISNIETSDGAIGMDQIIRKEVGPSDERRYDRVVTPWIIDVALWKPAEARADLSKQQFFVRNIW